MANQYYSIMTALLELGAFIGALQAGFVADKYSRKKAIGLSLSNFLLNDQFINISICVALGSIWFIIGAIIQTTSFSFAQLVVGRFIGGLGFGLLSAVAPMYISEVAPPNIRGALLAMEGATIVIGIVVMFYIVSIVFFHTPLIYLIFLTLFCIDVWFPIHRNDWGFRLPFLIQMAPCILLGIGLWKLPYSPRWLAGAGRDADCLAALMRLRRLPSTDPRLQAEWISIRAEAIQNREVIIKDHPSLLHVGT